MQRKDVAWRRYASRCINAIRERTTRVRISDHGSMFRGYARTVVDAVNQCSEYNTFVPALAFTFATAPIEIRGGHENRGAGKSKYSLFQLLRLNFDLMTGFSTAPMQMFSAFGIGIAILSVLFVVFLAMRRIFVGPEAEGVFTLFAIAFFLIGVALFGVGLLGEYVSRIYDEVRHRPRYIVGAVWTHASSALRGCEQLEQWLHRGERAARRGVRLSRCRRALPAYAAWRMVSMYRWC